MRRLLHVAMTRARKGLVLAWARGRRARHHAAPVALLRGGARGARARGGALRGGAVRPGRGPALDLPDHARRAARHGRARGRAARRDAARHLPRRRPGGGPLPRADQGGGADRARARGPVARDRAARGQRDPRPVRHRRAARDLRGVGARRLAARHRPRPGRAPGVDERLRRVARPVHPAPRPRADAVGLGHRHLPDLPAQVQVRARLPDPAGADDQPALRDRHAPGAGALPHRGRRLARAADASCSRSPGGAPASATPTTSCSSASARSRRSSATGAMDDATPRPSRSGSSARSPSRSARTCCAGASTASTATRTARTS